MRSGAFGSLLNPGGRNAAFGPQAGVVAAAGAAFRAASGGAYIPGGSISLPAGTAAGDLLVVWLLNNTAEPTMTGWTRAYDTAADLINHMTCLYRKATGSDGVTVTGGGNGCFLCAALGGATVNLPDGSSGNSSGSLSTSAVAPTCSSAAAGSVLMSAYAGVGTMSVTLPGGQSSMGAVTQANGYSIRGGYETVGSGLTGTRTGTLGSSASWLAGQLTGR